MDAYGRVRCAILGARGLVAQRFFQRLQYHPWLEPVAVIGSPTTSGTPYDDCLWSLEEERPDETGMTISSLEDTKVLISELRDLGVRIIFSALPNSPAEMVERPLANAGFIVISHAQINRLEVDVPLIVPEVNINHLSLLNQQAMYGQGRLISCSNCTVIPLALSLTPLVHLNPISSIRIETEQALSGGGRKMLAAGKSGEIISPLIPGESESIVDELSKIFGMDLNISASCERVMRNHGHLAYLEVRFEELVSAHQVINAWREFTTRSQHLSLPSAPEQIIHFVDAPIVESHRWVGAEGIKHPGIDLRAAMGVAISNVEIEGNILRFSVFADNTIRGAAGYGVLLAEQLLADGLMHDDNTILSRVTEQ